MRVIEHVFTLLTIREDVYNNIATLISVKRTKCAVRRIFMYRIISDNP